MNPKRQLFDQMTLKDREPIPDLLYHYTNMDGLLGIVRTGKLWLTHIRYLNDSLEYEFLWQLLQKQVKARLASSELAEDQRTRLAALMQYRADVETYVTSFSDDGGDRLSKWRGYCPTGIGFSIAFSGLSLERLVEKYNSPGIEVTKLAASVLPVEYLSTDSADTFDDIINGTWMSPVQSPGLSNERMFSTLMSAFAWAYKHDSFSEEREWRLSLSGFPIALPRPKFELQPAIRRILREPMEPVPGLFFRPGKSMLIPYREIDFREVDRNFIRKITVGPTPHQELSMRPVEGLLRSHGYTNCEITTSLVPYRHW